MIKPMFVLAAMMFAAPVLAQDAAPAAAALPMCSAKVTDGCQQTKGQEARAMSGAQAEARDAKSGGWKPNGGTSDKDMAAAAPMKMHKGGHRGHGHHRGHHKGHAHHMDKTTVTTTTTEAAPR